MLVKGVACVVQLLLALFPELHPPPQGRPEHPAGVRVLLLVVVRRGAGRGDKGLEVCGLGLRGGRWSTEWESSEHQKSLQSPFQSASSKVEPEAVFPVCSFFRTGRRSLWQDRKAAKEGGIQVRLGREFSALCWRKASGMRRINPTWGRRPGLRGKGRGTVYTHAFHYPREDGWFSRTVV